MGQVCMDDLASEGLLLIRMEPDDRGRYGFIVKVRNYSFHTSKVDDPVPLARNSNCHASNTDDPVPY